jgi:hypothetical protein
MNIRDPFLNSIGIVLDRVAVWTALTGANFVVIWAGVWQRGLGLHWSVAVKQLESVVTGTATPLTRTLFALTLTVALLATSGVCMWLFARWQRQGELHGRHVRGPRLEA